MKESDILSGLILSLGRKEYSALELRALAKPFGITESSVRTWLSRRSAKDFLVARKEGRNGIYSLSDKWKSISTNIALSFAPPDWTDWDGFWWGYLFSIPENKKEERHRIRIKLSGCRFAPWYGGFWIRPRNRGEFVEKHLGASVIPALAGELISFKPEKDITPLTAQRLWKLKAMGKEFQRGITILEKELSASTDYTPMEAHVQRIKTGDAIVTLLFQDPLLPPAYLPETWVGGKLHTLFQYWDRELCEKARPFWDGIFKEAKEHEKDI